MVASSFRNERLLACGAVMAAATSRSESLALLDFGSHAARLLYVRIRPGHGYRVLDEVHVRTRLALGARRSLPPRAVRETLGATRRFLGRHKGVQRTVVVATAAVRDARNSETLLGPLRERPGTDVRVLSWHEEARLGARAALAWGARRDATVVDLGGGSLQVSQVRDGHIVPLVSVPLGVVRSSARFLRHDPAARPRDRPTPACRRRSAQGRVVVVRRTLVGLGGTVRALSRMSATLDGRRARSVLTFTAVGTLRRLVAALSRRRRRELPGLKAHRVDTIVAGAVIAEMVMALGGYNALHVCPHGVRHGVLLEAALDRAPSR